MKIHSTILNAAAACLLVVALTPRAAAMISDEDFNALKSAVTNQDQRIGQQDQRIGQLEKLHEQDQQTHQQDQQTIQQLEQRLGETQTLATNAVEKADAAALAQATKPRSALHNFTMVGDAEIQYAKTDGNDTHGGFLLADFAPIFLYQANNLILFEAGFDIMLQNGSASGNYYHNSIQGTNYTHDSGISTSVNLSFAQLDYLVNDSVTFVGGYLLLPLGTYAERGAGWLNKIPDDPLGVEFLPGAGAGVQLRGALPIGESGQSLTYAVYCANGPSSVDGTGNAYTLDSSGNKISNLDLGGNVGIQSNGNTGNLHGSPSGGGRVGWFVPWGDHKDFEIGASGMSGVWDDAGSYNWTAGVLDYALHLGPNVEIKGEYINAWYGTSDAGTVHPWGVWTQASYKLAGLNLDLPVINDFELVGRYDTDNDGLGTSTDRVTAGFVYYLTNTLLFEGDYEWLHSTGPNALPSNDFVIQLSYGF